MALKIIILYFKHVSSIPLIQDSFNLETKYKENLKCKY